MAQITWRNVDTPNLSGVGDSIRTFSGLLGNATSGLSDALGNFQNSARQEAGNAVMANALQYQDPTEYRNALASGQLFQGVDPSLISSRTMENLDRRAGTLLEQAGQQQNLDFNKYRTDRTQKLDAASDAAGPALQALSVAYQSGDPRQVQAAQAKYGDVLSTLQPEDINRYMTSLQGQGGSAINQQLNRFNLNTTMRDDADTQAASGILSQIRRGALTADDARILAESVSNQLSPGAQSRLQSMLDRVYPGTYGAGAGGTSSPGSQGTRSGSVYDTTFGFTPTSTPITQMSIGDVVKHQDGMKSTLGASPVGAYQINQATLQDFGPKVFGSDWQNTKMTPENQDKLGEAIFNARKGGDLTGTWAALPNKSAGAYKDVTWDQMKNVISQAETGQSVVNPQDQQAVSNLATGMINTRAMENNAVGITPDYLKSLSDTATAGEVAKRLIANDFAGADNGVIVGRIQDIAQRAGVSPAVAGTIMQRALTGVPEGYVSRGIDALNPFISNELGGRLRLNDAAVDQMIEGVKRGEPLEASVRNMSTQQAGANIMNAQNQLNNATQQLATIQQRISTGQTNLLPLLPKYQQAVQNANAMLQAATGQVTADPENLAPTNFKSQASVDRAVDAENKARAERYLRQATGAPAYMQPR
jgi:cell fate (sporulation/competence/biofilm development) regulator YmcA (YheA/YmcA/DUF963 family)